MHYGTHDRKSAIARICSNFSALTLTITLALIAPCSLAGSTNLQGTANFRAALSLGNEVNMDFGDIDYMGGALGTGDRVRLGTDGSIAYNGVFAGAGVGTAGYVEILSGTTGRTVEIFCERSAKLTNPSGDSIGLRGIRISEAGAQGPWPTGTTCQNLGGAATTTMVLTAGTNAFYMGGQLRGHTATGTLVGAYSTANAGGNDIVVDVVYQ